MDMKKNQYGSKRTLVSLLLCLCLLAGILPSAASAQESGDTVHYLIGDSPYTYLVFDKTTGTITGSHLVFGDLVIPAEIDSVKVRVIGDRAFSENQRITSVTVPEGVTGIADGAFQGCSSLSKLALPDSLSTITGGAFNACSSLTSVTIPKGVTYMTETAFFLCNRLEAFQVSEENTEYSSENGILYDKAKTKLIQCPQTKTGKLTLPSGLTELTQFAFNNCASLTEIVLPESLRTIGFGAFTGCTSITALELPEGLTTIRDKALDECSSLTSITLPASVTDLGWSVFENCKNLQTISVAGGDSFSSQDGILYNKAQTKLLRCPPKKAGAVLLPEGVTEIQEYAFSGCAAMTAVTLPDSLTVTGRSAFLNCASLKSVRIPKNVTDLNSAFFLCSGLEEILVDAENPNFSSENGLLYDKQKTTLLQCPSKKSGFLTLPSSVTAIDSWAFDRCAALTSVTLPEGLAEIDTYAFSGCTSLTSITLPESLTTIGMHAFNGCSSLTQIHLPAGVASIESVGNTLSCRNLQSISVAEENPSYSSENGVLYNKAKTTLLRYPVGKRGSAAFPATLTGIGGSSFTNCAYLTDMALPEGVTAIGSSAFLYSGLRTVTLPKTVSSVGASAFAGNKSLTSVTVSQEITEGISESAFFDRYIKLTPSLTLYGEDGSYAEAYAAALGIPFRTGTPSVKPDTPPTPSGPSEEPEPEPEPGPGEPTVETSTAPDGTVTTTTTWPDGKVAETVKAPGGGVAITVTSSAGETLAAVSLPAEPGEAKTFTDVKEGSWYKAAVDTATGLGLFAGTTETEFSPDSPLTRAMLVTVLHRLSGEAEFGVGDGAFTDVPAGSWYADAVDWANAAGVTSGTGSGFSPEGRITREQLVTMLYRYAELIGADTKGRASLDKFQDSGSVSKYAAEAMEWAVELGLIQGRDGNLVPQGNATRAEVAAVLTRFSAFLSNG